ncbi:MAG: thiamine pyrophosphate-binding protein [Actinomycetota bacterium]|nr:thiamine pyrophosphate-binding protein [Actinomycetota bacterium]
MSVSTARQAFFEVARSEGARYLFSNPGTTELPIFDELAEEDPGLELILCLHEAVAVGAADGYAQATGRPSLVNLHILPGLANGLCHMANAAWSRSPVVVTAGQQDTRHLVQEPMLAGDLVSMAKPFTKFAYECRRPDEVGIAMRRAFKVAASPPQGPTFVSIPWDTMDESVEIEVPPPSPIDYGAAASSKAIARAADLLLNAQRPLIVAGDEVARAGAVEDLVALAEAVGARVAGEPIHGRLVFPQDHPLWNGALFPNNPGVRAVLEQYDVVLIAGAIAFAPLHPSPVGAVPPEVKLIHLDADAYQIARVYAVEEGLWGDVRASVQSLTATVTKLATSEQKNAITERVTRWSKERESALDAMATGLDALRGATPMKPLIACKEIFDNLDPGTAIVDDAVTNTVGVRTMMRSSEPGTYFFTRGGGLGWGMPASIGVKLADPDRPVVAIVGDGTALYAPQALWTMAHHDVPVVTIVLNNRSYLILKAGLKAMAGKAAKFDRWPGMHIDNPPVDFPSLAKGFGIDAERIEDANDVGKAVASALAAKKPALIEVMVDGSL